MGLLHGKGLEKIPILFSTRNQVMLSMRRCWEQLISPRHSCQLCRCYTKRGKQDVVCCPTLQVMEPGIFPPEMAPNRSWGGAQGTGEAQGEQLWQSQVLAALAGIMGRFLLSVSDWYLIFQHWNIRFVGLFPWLRGIY